MGAASIAKIIAKWVDEGYPEEVAERIAKGELPMDDASRVARREEQMTPELLWRGHYAPHAPKSNQDMFMSDSYDNAFTYADAVSDGTVTPLRHNAENLAYVNAGGKHDRSVTTNNIKNPGIRRGVIRGTDEISDAVKHSYKYQGTHFKDLRDDMHNTSSTKRANVYNVLGSRPDVKIRHPDAAFDPEYNGPNIMGGAALPVAAGLLAAGQSDESEASVASLARRGLSIARKPSHLDGSLFSVRSPDGKEVAHADMGDNLSDGLYARYMEVYPENRGSGLMSETYNAIEEITGKKITPSDWLTEDGVNFWVKRDRKLIENMYNDGEFDWDGELEDRVGKALDGLLFSPVKK